MSTEIVCDGIRAAYEKKYPENKKPREAINAAKKVLENQDSDEETLRKAKEQIKK